MTAEVEFRREMNRNYMVMKPERGRSERYAARMLAENRISGFLPFHEKQIDGRSWFYYDVTSKQPLERILEFRNLTGNELERLLTDLLFALKELERYLLDGSSMELKPEFIYVEPDSFKSWFCLIPGKYGDFSAGFCDLAQYLLEHVNHRDGDAVVLAFSVFRESRKENFGVEDIGRCLRKGEEAAAEQAPDGKQLRSGEQSYREARPYRRDQQQGEARPYRGGRQQGEARPYREGQQQGEARPYRGDQQQGVLRSYAGVQPPDERQSHAGSQKFFRRKAAAKQGTDEAENEESEKEGGKHSKYAVWIPALLGAIMILLPSAVIILRNFDGLFRYRWILGAAELCLGVSCVGFIRGGNQPRVLAPDEGCGEEEPWEVWFEEEAYEETGVSGMPENGGRPEERTTSAAGERGEVQTVLLTALPDKQESRRLRSVTGNLEISMGYFPFLIGKSRDMADYCLNEPGVSRLHIKIEEKEKEYFVTDLNSTNGTRVNGRLLEANETCELPIGSELEIAGRKFWFQ